MCHLNVTAKWFSTAFFAFFKILFSWRDTEHGGARWLFAQIQLADPYPPEASRRRLASRKP